MGLVALWRYPLKSALGEPLDSVDMEPGGLTGDRIWACVDGADGTVGSAKQPRRWGRLLEIGTALSGDDLTLHVGGSSVRAGSAAADAVLSAHLGRPVRLTRTLPAEARLHRVLPDEAGMVPEWMAGSRPGDETVSDVGGVARLGRFSDFGALHLVTTGALARLGERLGAEVSPARFRPNLVLDLPDDPEPGAEVRLGDVVLRVALPTPRCVIPGLGHGDAPADRAVLGTLARDYRITVPGLGRAACFGTYADVVRPGRLRTGQPVH